MAGLVPAIYVFEGAGAKAWMPGTSPGMTILRLRAIGVRWLNCPRPADYVVS
jgi:hypothetical protein